MTVNLNEQKPARCIECANFAGRRRDHRAFLFKTGRGYCDAPEHAGGPWNVVQDIVGIHPCKHFVQADPDTVNSRRRALEYYGLRNK